MRWTDERYIRVYTRDTLDWQALSFEAQGLFVLIMRKVDRAGIAKLGKHGKRGVAMLVCHPARWDSIEPALEELIADGCLRVEGETLVVPNFMEAQEALQSEAQRKRAQRERERDLAAALGVDVTKRDLESQNVTKCPAAVTDGHTKSRTVTDCHSDPIRSDPADPEISLPPACARSNGNAKRPSGFDLLTWFGVERASVFPNVLPWSTAMDKDGSADTFARLLPDDAVQDVKPSMRLALEHYRDGKAGWTDSRLKDPSFAFGAWKSQFTSLREELHGLSPKAAQPESPSGKPQASTVRYPRLGQ